MAVGDPPAMPARKCTIYRVEKNPAGAGFDIAFWFAYFSGSTPSFVDSKSEALGRISPGVRRRLCFLL